MITVSESAAAQVVKLMSDEGMPENSFVRVGVKGGGLNGKGFEFFNPNANRTCGCGESFSL